MGNFNEMPLKRKRMNKSHTTNESHKKVLKPNLKLTQKNLISIDANYDDDSSTESLLRNEADTIANQYSLTVEGKNFYGYEMPSPLLPNYQENKA